MGNRNKPYDPAASKARDAEAARMVAQGATVKRDRAGHILSAYRSNVFNLLLTRGAITPGHHDAASRLADDWREWKGLAGRPEPRMEFVCGGGELDEPETAFLGAKRRSQAFRRVCGAMLGLQPEHRRLLRVFMVATVEEDRPMAWRGLVERATGEMRRDHQTALVALALEDLRCAYQEPRERAA